MITSNVALFENECIEDYPNDTVWTRLLYFASLTAEREAPRRERVIPEAFWDGEMDPADLTFGLY